MSDHNTRLQAIEASLRRIASKLGIAGIDHQPAPLPRLLTSGAAATASAGVAAASPKSETRARKGANEGHAATLRKQAYLAARQQERARLASIFAAPVAMRDPGLTFIAASVYRRPADVVALLEKMGPLPQPAAAAPVRPTARQIIAAAERVRAMRDHV